MLALERMLRMGCMSATLREWLALGARAAPAGGDMGGEFPWFAGISSRRG